MLEDVLPRQLAAVRGGASRADLGPTILKLLDRVWPVLRGQHVKTGHNVVMYFGGLAHISKLGSKCSATSSTRATCAIRKHPPDRR